MLNIGIAHLVIKPENFLCTDDFRLQVIDFDSAVRVWSEDSLICRCPWYSRLDGRLGEEHDEE